MIPLALGETWFAVFGGLIPIIGLVLVGLVLWHAVKPPERPKPPGKPDDGGPT